MELEEKVDEVLETLWILTQEEKKDFISPQEAGGELEEGILEALLQADYITFAGNQIKLTDKGRREAARTVRRHRLAERLLVDVLDTKDAVVMHDTACKFEHLLDRGLEENICTLLGHPKLCPHGKPIPPGRCCYEGQKQPQKVISPLSELAPGQGGTIAYVYAPEASQLHKLMSMGILPGNSLRLLQSFPSYVFQSGQTQFAVDKGIASAIYVRLEETEEPPAPGEEPRRTRWHWAGWGRERQRRGSAPPSRTER